MKRRRFIDASAEQRCTWPIRLRDGSGAQCGRWRKVGTLCRQHEALRLRALQRKAQAQK